MIKRLLKKLWTPDPENVCSDADQWRMDIVARVQPYTMASVARILSTINAAEYVIRCKIEGSIVECGVWKGGNMMAAALTLQRFDAIRPLYLFDTFTGMTEPEDVDTDMTGVAARREYSRFRKKPNKTQWCEASIEEVQTNMASTSYPTDMMHFVKGPVESTLPAATPNQISVLRLDTDWYSSTLHELEHLYPHVQPRGAIIIDDYGHWQGARRAVDEYLKSHNIQCLLHRIDYAGREFIKP